MKHGTYSVPQRCFAMLLALLLTVGILPPVKAEAAVTSDSKLMNTDLSIDASSVCNIGKLDNTGLYLRGTYAIDKNDTNEDKEYILWRIVLKNDGTSDATVGTTTIAAGSTGVVHEKKITIKSSDAPSDVMASIATALNELTGVKEFKTLFTVDTDVHNFTCHMPTKTEKWTVTYGNGQNNVAFPRGTEHPALEIWKKGTDTAADEKVTESSGKYTLTYGNEYYLKAGSNGSGINFSATGNVTLASGDSTKDGEFYKKDIILDGSKLGNGTVSAENKSFCFPFEIGNPSTLNVEVKGKEYDAASKVEANLIGAQDGNLTYGVPNYQLQATLTLADADKTSAAGGTYEVVVEENNSAVAITPVTGASGTFNIAANGQSDEVKVKVIYKAAGYADLESNTVIFKVLQNDRDFLKMTQTAPSVAYGTKKVTISLDALVTDTENAQYTYEAGTGVTSVEEQDGAVTILSDGFVPGEDGTAGTITITRTGSEVYSEKSMTFTIKAEAIQTHTGAAATAPTVYSNGDITVTKPEGFQISKDAVLENFQDSLTFAAEELEMGGDGKGENAEDIYYRDSDGVVTKGTVTLLYDNVKPVIENITFTGGVGEKADKSGDTKYLGQTVTVSATVTDAASGVKEDSVSCKVGNTTVSMTKSATENVYTADITVEAGNTLEGAVTITAKDNAGNESDEETSTGKIYVDKKAPYGSFKLDNKLTWDKLWEGNWLYNVLTGSISPTPSFEDDFSKKPTVLYYVDENPSGVITDVSQIEDNKWAESVSIPDNSKLAVYAKVTDEAGNTDYFSTSGLIIDNKDPAFTDASAPSVTYATQFYKEAIALKVSATDIITTEDAYNYSGIKSITVTIDNGDAQQKVTIKDGNTEVEQMTVANSPALDVENGFSLEDLKKVATMEHTFTINLPVDEYDDEVEVTITVVDNALRDTEDKFALKLDNIKPVVAISHEQGGNENQTSYIADPTVKVAVTENNFVLPESGSHAVKDNPKTEITVKLDGAELHKNGEVWGDWITAGNVHTATWTLPESAADGKYEISVTSTDKAGNSGTSTATFLLDKTKPVTTINMPASEGKVEEEDMYKSDSLAIPIEIIEKNFNGDKVTLKVYKYDPSKGEPTENDLYTGYSAIDWAVGTDDKHTKTLTFNAEGHYRIVVDCNDGPGNPADQKTASFCIDRTKSEGTIISRGKTAEDVINVLFSGGNLFYNLFKADQTVLLHEVHDKYEDSDEVGSGIKSKLYWDFVAENGEELPAEVPSDAEWKTYNDAGILVESDKRYIIFFKLVDNANNETDIFHTTGMIQDTDAPGMTDHNAPTIKVENADTALDNGKANGEQVRFKVTATDPMTANSSSLSGVKDITMDFKEGTEEAVKGKVKLSQENDANTFQDTQKPTWAEIKGDQVKTEEFLVEAIGNEVEVDVQVTFTAIDHAGNEATADSPVLNLDTQKPRVEITHGPSGADAFCYYKDAPTVQVSIKDKNFDPEATTITIYKNGAAYTPRKDWTRAAGDTEEYETVYSWTVEEDGDYTIHVATTDKAGNNTTTVLPDFTKYSPEINHFVLDTDAPNVTVAMDDPDYDFLEGSQYQYNMKDDQDRSLSQRTATVTILERNFKAKDVVISVTQNGNAVSFSQKWVTTPETQGSRSENDKHTMQLTFANDGQGQVDGDYVITVSYTDLAGNEASPKETQYLFAIDSTPPTAEISQSVTDTVWTKLLETLTFGIWKNESITVFGTFSDATTAVAQKYYHIETSDSAEITGFVNREFLKKQGDSYWNDFNGSVPLDREAQYVVYFKAVDNVGNDDYFSTDGIIYDTTKPNGVDLAAPKITITTDKPDKGVYGGDVKVKIDVADPVVNNSYSGLKSVTYTVTADGVKTQPGANEAPLYSFTLENPTPEQLEASRVFTQTITVDAEKNDSNNVVVRVDAVDNAGNTNTNSIKLIIDTTPPVVEVSYDNNEVRNGKYFKASRTATIKVTDRNFDWEDMKVSITSSSGKTPAVVPGASKGDDHYATVTFDHDSDFTFEILEVLDKADNAAGKTTYDGEAPNAFVVDKTKPVLKFEIRDTVGAVHDNIPYFQSIREALLTVTEHNFFSGEVTAILHNEVTGQSQPLDLTDWIANGDEHRAGASIDAEGIYTVSVSYVDLAGNEADPITFPKFGLDLHAPTVQVEGVEDGKNYPEKLEIKIRVQDTYLYAEGIEVLMTVQNIFGLKTIEPIRAEFEGNDFVIVFEDPAPIRENDGIYHLSINVTDKSGRTAQESRSFIVNRYGSIYYTEDDFTAETLKHGYINKAPELKIIELNPNKLTEYEIDLAVSGNVYNLDEDVNFFAKESIVKRKDGQTGAVPAEGWYRYDYTIASNSFMENEVLRQGHYTIILSSKDAAANLNSSTSYLLEDAEAGKKDSITYYLMEEEDGMRLELVLDAENPAVVLSGVENDEIYKTNEQNVQFTVDDSNLREVIVWVVADYGGKDAKVLSRTIYGTAGKAEDDYQLEGVQMTESTQLTNAELADLSQAMLLMENNEKQTVIVTAVDMAGNETSTQVEDFTISTNSWLLFLRSVWFIPAVAGTIGLFAAIMYLFYKKNQKERDAMGVS